MGNGFFRTVVVVLGVWTAAASAQAQRNKRFAFADGKISMELADGWKKIEREGTLGAFESSDQKSSMFFTIAAAAGASGMPEILEGALDNFEQAFIVKKTGDFKSGQIQGPNKKWTAIFTTLELEMEAKPHNVPFRFYITIFDTGSALYMIQGSTMMPVRDVREKEIFRMIRSVIATK
ncbi:MAG: hypothetical protein HKN23_07575 [Verrucomicrobiales bacterium]|nr:hypothetical protein [Verrucomicrobiales bacterium]